MIYPVKHFEWNTKVSLFMKEMCQPIFTDFYCYFIDQALQFEGLLRNWKCFNFRNLKLVWHSIIK